MESDCHSATSKIQTIHTPELPPGTPLAWDLIVTESAKFKRSHTPEPQHQVDLIVPSRMLIRGF